MRKLAIILLNWNGEKDTVSCIKSIKDDVEHDIFILDNKSSEKSIDFLIKRLSLRNNDVLELDDFLKKDKSELADGITLIKSNENLGFAKGNNVIWKKIYTNYEYCLLLNNDTELTEKSLDLLVDFMDRNPNVGVSSTDIRLYDSPDVLWNAGGYFTWYGDRKYYSDKYISKTKRESIKTEFVTGCVMMVRKSVVDEIGVLTEDFFFGEEDFNYCKRLKKSNIDVQTLLTTKILHKVGKSAMRVDKYNKRYTLHFVSRIIDMKNFYSPFKWRLWHKFYLVSIFIHSVFKTKNLKQSINRIKAIEKYIYIYNEVSKSLFHEIMNN